MEETPDDHLATMDGQATFPSHASREAVVQRLAALQFKLVDSLPPVPLEPMTYRLRDMPPETVGARGRYTLEWRGSTQ